MIEVDRVWKVFGSGNAKDAVGLAEQGATRAEILSKTDQTIGVRDVSFSVGRGETFVVMGLSGSGKSTLIRCMSRLIEPTNGRVLVEGEDLLTMDEAQLRGIRRTKMSMVFQHFGLFPHKRVIDNVAYGLEVQGIPKAIRRQQAGVVLETVGLTAWAYHYPQQLSGGMQQRVGLGRALALDPEILFFDEPFSALDPLIRRDMQDELIGLQTTKPRTIVFITHDFAEALRLGDRIAIMKDGVFDQIGTPEELVQSPATDYVREFTNDVPKANVLTAATVMTGRPSNSTRRVHARSKVAVLVPMLLSDPTPVDVVDDNDSVLGCVSTSDIAGLFSEAVR